jgi:hypothetical protein
MRYNYTKQDPTAKIPILFITFFNGLKLIPPPCTPPVKQTDEYGADAHGDKNNSNVYFENQVTNGKEG